ncbi:MAG: hypothetical protein M0Z60_08810 [Nitrospiraceae bacterium]|nr:hypothetical protein [Nitrospiraceae bacterium]
MSLKDIEKLKERVEKDPNSKLFVPLAEEYRKEGMLDDAISVLMSGIERQPGYMSARVSLGKIFLEKGMTNEARGEFENVIKSIPDNLYAHKKLAEIYRDMGRKDMSVQSYRTVLKLNPLDEDSLANLRDLEEEKLQDPGKAPAGIPEEPLAAVEEAGGEQPVEAVAEEETTADALEMPAAIDVDDLNAFKDSIFGDKSVAEDVDILEGAEYEVSEAEDEPLEEEEALEVVEEPSETEMSFADVGAVLEETPSPAPGETEEELTFEDEASGAGQATASVRTSGEQTKVGDADRFVADGDYVRAIQAYREILSADPDNRMVLQRVEELRTLLKLMGKDKDALIARMSTFLEGITKRRNEFYGRS